MVVHTTDGALEGALAWLTDRDSGVSAHHLVALDGRVFSLVDERDAAHHAGRVRDPTAALVRARGGDPNLYTVGIELEDGGDPLGVERPAAQYEAAARLVAAAVARWGFPLDREHVVGHREVFAAKDCPGNADLDRIVALARAFEVDGAEPQPHRVACLIPARNAATDLPGALESASAFADFVVALDDGSTDSTRQVLDAAPGVAALLSSPRRATYAGWDDAANRRRLLDAARELRADWVVFLDADERIDPEDAAALRDFLLADALPGLAYGLRLHRAWADGVTGRCVNVYRAFHAGPGADLPDRRLHFTPVPSSLEAQRLVRTTVRLRHLDSAERLRDRLEKYREADPAGEFSTAGNPLLAEPTGDVQQWRRRPAGLEVLDFESEAPVLACLLPARNSAADVPGYLESARAFADAVIALDDGSTDATAALLEAAPEVTRVIRNPRREGFAGWDDAANRQALLDAAVEAGADWALFLDADERVAADDAKALRRLVDAQADPACAYGFRVHRMVGDEGHFDANDLWAYRLFAVRPGARLPRGKLHALPVPDDIPAELRVRTSVRIKHLASLSAERRAARVAKYEEADPGRRWQRDYSELGRPPGELQEWEPRPDGLPLLVDVPPAERPVLSAIVIARDDADTIAASVGSVVGQECSEPFEVIVVVSASPPTAAVVRRELPGVRLVELDDPALPGRARNAGVRVARGDYLSFPGSHIELPPGSLAARISTHDRGFAMVTGSILNGTRTRSGWASYFIDHSTSLPGRPSGELGGAPSHCSYTREALEQAGPFREDLRAGEDTAMNEELTRRGHRAYREASIQLVHHSRCTNPWRLARHHFTRGRAMARIMLAESPSRRALARFLVPYSRRRLGETGARVRRWGPELVGEYEAARPLIALGVGSALAGAVAELLRPRRRRAT